MCKKNIEGALFEKALMTERMFTWLCEMPYRYSYVDAKSTAEKNMKLAKKYVNEIFANAYKNR